MNYLLSDRDRGHYFATFYEHDRLKIFSTKQSAQNFPFSPDVAESVQNGTLRKIDQIHLDSPYEVLTNLNYGRILEGHGSNGSVRERIATPLAPPPDEALDNEAAVRRYADRVAAFTRVQIEQRRGMSRFIQCTEQPWKTVTLADWKLGLGFVDIIPPGMDITGRYDEQEYVIRPRYESALFQRREIDQFPIDTHPRDESEAREFVHATTQNRACWGGCTERKLKAGAEENNYCCYSVTPRNIYESSDTIRQEHEKNTLNQSIECPRNDGVYSTVSTLNLDKKVPLRFGDNEENYIHCFSFAPHHNEHRSTMHKVLNSRPTVRENFSPLELARLFMAEIEFGVMGVDSGLQISMDNHRRKLMSTERQRFLTASRSYRDDKMRYVNGTGVFGPPLASPTQLYHFGSYRLRNIANGRWQPQIYNADPARRALPISHRRTYLSIKQGGGSCFFLFSVFRSLSNR